MGKTNQPARRAEAPTLLQELDKFVAAVGVVEQRLCAALAGSQEATLRLVVKADRGRIVSVRLEANEDLLAADQTATAAT